MVILKRCVTVAMALLLVVPCRAQGVAYGGLGVLSVSALPSGAGASPHHQAPLGQPEFESPLAPLLPVQVQLAASAPAPASTRVPQATPPAAPEPTPQPTPKPPWWRRITERLQPGARLGISRLVSAKSRANFGNGLLGLRPSYFRLRPGPARGTFGPDYDWSYVHSNGNRLARVVLGADYRRALTGDGSERPPTQLYFDVSAGLAPTSIRSRLSQEDSGTRVGLQGTLLVGYLIKKRISLRASYTAATRIAGFDLSSYSVSGDYKF